MFFGTFQKSENQPNMGEHASTEPASFVEACAHAPLYVDVCACVWGPSMGIHSFWNLISAWTYSIRIFSMGAPFYKDLLYVDLVSKEYHKPLFDENYFTEALFIGELFYGDLF